MSPHPLRTFLSRWREKCIFEGFGRNVLILFTGTALGQLGAVLASPILTRLYSPAMFGVLGNFTALITILGVVASLRYEMALPLAKTRPEAANMLAVCGLSLAFTTASVTLALALLMHFASPGGPLWLLEPYWGLLPVGFACVGAYQVLVYFATWRGDYRSIARTKLYQGAAGPLTQIGLGLGGCGVWGLTAGFLAGQSMGSGRLFCRLVPGVAADMTWQGMKSMARRFVRFPRVSSWSALIDVLGSGQLLLLVAPILYSSRIAGFIFLTDRIIGRPLLLVSTSILQVYLGEISQSRERDPAAVRRRFLHLGAAQFAIVLGWLALVNAAAPFVFPVAFGRNWSDAVLYLQILSISYLPQMVMGALAHTLQMLEKLGLSAAWETGRLMAVLAAFALSYRLGLSAPHGILLYSLAQATAQVILFGLMYRSIQSLQKGPHA